MAVGEVLTEFLHNSSFVLVGTRSIPFTPKHTAMRAFIGQKKPRSGRIPHSAQASSSRHILCTTLPVHCVNVLPTRQSTRQHKLGVCFRRLMEPLPAIVGSTVKCHPLAWAEVFPFGRSSLANALRTEPRRAILVVDVALEDRSVPAASLVSQRFTIFCTSICAATDCWEGAPWPVIIVGLRLHTEGIWPPVDA